MTEKISDMHYDWKRQVVWVEVNKEIWIEPIETIRIDRNELEKKTIGRAAKSV
jgi:hypothetical protein